MKTLTNRRILLGITGGIAAYKAADLTRRLQDQGAEVRVVMTQAATEFITPLTMQALSNHVVHLDLLDSEAESAMGHIQLARWADKILIAPASANFMAKLAEGRGDDLLSTICLAAECEIIVAPAMNQAMWADKATQQNIIRLSQREISIFAPEDGLQACGEIGTGRLMEISQIVERLAASFPSSLLQGLRVMITAGPTREAIDPVRYISNHSSGKQGYLLAEAAVDAGALVTLVSGPTALTAPDRVAIINVTSADEMYAAVMSNIDETDIFIGVAAVADYRPELQSTEKIKKDKTAVESSITLKLVENPDIIAAVSHSENRPFTVGFAAETQNLLGYARRKLQQKNLDMIVANNVADQTIGFNSDNNQTSILWDDHVEDLALMSKANTARSIIEMIATRLEQTHHD